MIEIVIKNERLDLPENLSIPYEFNSSLFDFEKIKSSRIFFFFFDRTPKNSRLLLFPQFSNFSEIKNVLIFSFGFQVFTASLKTKLIHETSFDLDLKVGSDYFLTDIATRKITEIMPSVSLPYESSDGISDQLKTYPEVNFSFPRLVFFDGEVNSTYSHWIPFFYLSFVVRNIFLHYGFQIKSNLFETDQSLKKILIVWMEDFVRPAGGERMKFIEDLPAILISDFIKDLINITDSAIIFDDCTNSVEIKKILDVIRSNNYSKSKYIINDFVISEFDDIYKLLKFETDYTAIEEGVEVNSVQDIIAAEGKEYKYKLLYETSLYNKDGFAEIPYSFNELKSHNKLIFGFYDRINRNLVNDDGITNISNDNSNTRHFLHNYKSDRFKLINNTKYKATCNITFHASFLKELKSGLKVIHNNQSYLVHSLRGNITGKEYETFGADLIKI